jgi:diacylglycerol kinase (ATP)
MERKIIYLVNPISGTRKKDVLMQQVTSATTKKEIPFEVFPTSISGNYDLVEDKIVNERFTDVVIIGGDGTVNQVIKALRHLDVQFGIIPMGSGNGLAFSAQIPSKPMKALDVIFEGNAKRTDAFLTNDQFSCMLSGLGLDAQVAHDFANKAGRGLLTYTQQSLLNYFKAHPYQFEVKMNGFSFFTDAYFICIANSNQFGNNVKIAPEASISDGLLDIVIVQKMNKAKLPFAILQQIRGNNKLQTLVNDIAEKNILYFQATELSISNLKLAPLHIDGEPKNTEEKLEIKILPGCFKLIQKA